MSQMATRSQPIREDPFPPIERFQKKAKLPTYKDIIGVIRHMAMQKHAITKLSFEVAKRVYSKWYQKRIPFKGEWFDTIKKYFELINDTLKTLIQQQSYQ